MPYLDDMWHVLKVPCYLVDVSGTDYDIVILFWIFPSLTKNLIGHNFVMQTQIKVSFMLLE